MGDDRRDGARGGLDVLRKRLNGASGSAPVRAFAIGGNRLFPLSEVRGALSVGATGRKPQNFPAVAAPFRHAHVRCTGIPAFHES